MVSDRHILAKTGKYLSHVTSSTQRLLPNAGHIFEESKALGWSIVPHCEIPCNDTISSAVGRGVDTSSLETPFPFSRTGHYRFHWTECTHCPLWINMLITVKLQNNFLLMYWLCAKYDIYCLKITLLLFWLTSPSQDDGDTKMPVLCEVPHVHL